MEVVISLMIALEAAKMRRDYRVRMRATGLGDELYTPNPIIVMGRSSSTKREKIPSISQLTQVPKSHSNLLTGKIRHVYFYSGC